MPAGVFAVVPGTPYLSKQRILFLAEITVAVNFADPID
jgi:hypothetical protein